MNKTDETLFGFLETILKNNALLFDFKDQFPLEQNSTKTSLFFDFQKMIRYDETRELILTMIQKEKQVIAEADIIIGMESFGSTIATMIATQTKKRLITNGEIPKNAKPGKCIIVKDQIVNGRNTIGFIDDLQNAGFDCLGIFVVFNEDLPITKQRFDGETGVRYEKVNTKLVKPCPIFSILTPTKIYTALVNSQNVFAKILATNYQKNYRDLSQTEEKNVQSKAAEPIVQAS